LAKLRVLFPVALVMIAESRWTWKVLYRIRSPGADSSGDSMVCLTQLSEL